MYTMPFPDPKPGILPKDRTNGVLAFPRCKHILPWLAPFTAD